MSGILQYIALLRPYDATWANIAIGSSLFVIGTLATFYIWRYVWAPYFLSFKNLPGPDSNSLFWGNFRQIVKAPTGELHNTWLKQYGPTFRYHVIMGQSRFFTIDTTAMSYILSHSYMFPKPEQTRQFMSRMLGNGVLIAEGDDHKKQRKVLNASFSPAAIREMVPIFFDKAYELRDKMAGMIEDHSIPAAPTPVKEGLDLQGGRKIDVLRYLGQCTLDVIGLAGFDYDFASLTDEDNELAEAFRLMLTAGQDVTILGAIQFFVPYLDFIPTKRRRIIQASRATMDRIGMKLVNDKKQAVLAAHGTGLEKGDDIGKDLLSVVVKANMAQDLPADQRMPDAEVLAQITTFMLAGNETSSTALTWILWTLSKHQDSQERLRKELMAVDEERPSMDTLASLKHLDNVVREVLRLLAPAPSTVRKAEQDCVVPLGTPVKGRDGKMIDSIKLKKGSTVFIPIYNMNTSTTIWGDDAEEYNPDRYDKAAADGLQLNQVPGVWGNLLTFLGGQRNCIGYRFALIEIKAILFVLLRSFTFEEMPDHPEIEKKASIVMRPRVLAEPEVGFQMPLLVKNLA